MVLTSGKAAMTRNPLPLTALIAVAVIFISGCVTTDQKPVFQSFSLSSPSPRIGEPFEVHVSASDDKGLTSLAIDVADFHETFPCNGQKQCSTTWSLSMDDAGSTTITITAVDSTQQQEQRSTVVSVVDDSGQFCGDSVCTGDETPQTCPADCGENMYGVTFIPGEWAGEWRWTALRDLGVQWIRHDLWMGDADYQEHFRERIERTITEGYGLWITLYHRDRSNIADTEGFDESERGGFPPVDPVVYQELVKQTIAPYLDQIRSQGKNPGDWLVIQIENEVAPADVAPPNPMRWWHGTSDEYLETLALGYGAVKSVDPEIRVAVAGIASDALEMAIGKKPPEPGIVGFDAWLDRLLRDGQFDMADVHLYHAIESIPEKVAWVRERWAGLLVATELGGPDERTGVGYSEDLHAEDLPARIQAVHNAGITWVFWLSLVDAPTADRLGQTVALLRVDGSRKPAFEAYQQLIAAGAD